MFQATTTTHNATHDAATTTTHNATTACGWVQADQWQESMREEYARHKAYVGQSWEEVHTVFVPG